MFDGWSVSMYRADLASCSYTPSVSYSVGEIEHTDISVAMKSVIEFSKIGYWKIS